MARKVWVYGRLLVPVAVVLAGLAGGLAVWVASGQAEQSPALDTSVPDEVRRLRSELRDPAAARALAEQFLATYAGSDVLSQLVHYEYAATFYSEGRHDEALAQFAALLDEYETIVTDVTSPYCRLDDAEFLSGVIHSGAGRLAEARACYMRIYEEMPGSSRQAGALQFLTRLLIEEEHASRQAGASEMVVDHADAVAANVATLVAHHAGDPACAGALLDLLNYHTRRFELGADSEAELYAVAAATADTLRSVAPEAPETVRAVVRLAELTVPQDAAAALALVDEGLDRAAGLGLTDGVVEAHQTRARLLEGLGRVQEAYEGLMLAHELAGDSPRAATMLVEANRLLVRQERASGSDGQRPTIDQLAVIRGNVEHALTAHLEQPACVEVLFDHVIYLSERARWDAALAAGLFDELDELVGYLEQMAPQAPLTLRAQLSLAYASAPDDLADMLPLVEQVAVAAKAAGDEPVELDALYARARLLDQAGQVAAAVDACLGIYGDWGDHPRAFEAVQLAQRMLATEEFDGYRRGSDAVDHAAAIEAHVARVLGEHGNRPESRQLVFDLINYYVDRVHWNPARRVSSAERIIALAAQLEELAVGTELELRARLHRATALAETEPQAALDLASAVADEARGRGHAAVAMESRLRMARVLTLLEEHAQARAIWEAELDEDFAALEPGAIKQCLRGEVAVAVVTALMHEDNHAEAVTRCAAIAADAELHEQYRATALLYQAMSLQRLAAHADARAVLVTLREQYPDTGAARAAARLQERGR